MQRIHQLDRTVEREIIAPLGRIGVIALATDFNIEQDLRRMLPDGFEIFTNRVQNANPLNLENLRGMAPDISRAAGGIVPGARLDVMIYACTSGTIANGEAEITRLVQSARPGIAVTTPATAAVKAMRHLGCRRISILTPYIEEVNRELLVYFEQQGLTAINLTGLGFDDDIEITGIAPQAIAKVAIETTDPEAEALFISCTALRTAGILQDLEKQLGIPVISSNQALVWHSLRLRGHQEPLTGLGRLLKLPA